jgi:hypothetical protein
VACLKEHSPAFTIYDVRHVSDVGVLRVTMYYCHVVRRHDIAYLSPNVPSLEGCREAASMHDVVREEG